MELRNTLETLLAGKFICQVSNSKLYQQLQDEATRSKVNETLAELGRHLCHTEHYEVYYCTYSDLSQVQDAKRVRNQFETIRDQIAPVLSFITLQMRAEGRDAVLISGDTVKFQDYSGTFGSNNLTVGANGKKIMRTSDNMTVSTNGASFTLEYTDEASGWLVASI